MASFMKEVHEIESVVVEDIHPIAQEELFIRAQLGLPEEEFVSTINWCHSRIHHAAKVGGKQGLSLLHQEQENIRRLKHRLAVKTVREELDTYFSDEDTYCFVCGGMYRNMKENMDAFCDCFTILEDEPETALRNISKVSLIGWAWARSMRNSECEGRFFFPSHKEVLHIFGRKLAHLASRGVDIPEELWGYVIWKK